MQVFKILPSSIRRVRGAYAVKMAYGFNHDGQYFAFHYCPQCSGWVEGFCQMQVDGYHCRRCDSVIGNN